MDFHPNMQALNEWQTMANRRRGENEAKLRSVASVEMKNNNNTGSSVVVWYKYWW